MGLSNRDYARYRPANGIYRRGHSSWEVWKKILIANVIVFLLQIFVTRPATEADFIDSQYFDDDVAMWEMQELQYQMDELHGSNQRSKQGADSDESSEPGAANTLTDEEKRAKVKELAKQRRDLMREQMMEYMPNVSIVQEWLQLDSAKIKEGQVWRLVTCGFCHARMSIWHIGMNMLLLYWFGQRLEQKYGSHEFAVYYFAALIFSSLCYVALDLYTGMGIPAIGASGAIFAIMILYGLLYPYEQIYIYFLFPVELRFLVIIYFIYELHPVLLMLSGDDYRDGVGHSAHLGGAIFGFLYWYNNWRLLPLVQQVTDYFSPQTNTSGTRSNSRRRGSDESSSIKIHREEQETAQKKDDSDLDAVLEKISREGRESLTDEELITLENASRKMREDRKSGD